MHRNTALLLALLGVIAALLIGLFIGRRLTGNTSPPITRVQPSPTPAVPSPSPLTSFFTHTECNLSFAYPTDFRLAESSDSAQLTNTVTDEQINLICGVDFPKPPLPAERIEEASVAGVLATVYHDASAENGSPIDVVVFDHPTTGVEIALFGFGEVFEGILNSLVLN